MRAFCGNCGSPIYRRSLLDPSILRIGVGSIKQRKAFTRCDKSGGVQHCRGWTRLPSFRPSSETRKTLIGAKTKHLMSPIVLVFGRRQSRKTRALNWPASKKRQGTKPREVGPHLSSGRYADLMSAPLLMVSATRVRGDVMSAYRRTEESGGASRRAREVQQRTGC